MTLYKTVNLHLSSSITISRIAQFLMKIQKFCGNFSSTLKSSFYKLIRMQQIEIANAKELSRNAV